MKKYAMNGKTYTKLTAIADELGLSRIRPSQFNKYGITEVNDQDTVIPAAEDITQANTPDIAAADEVEDTTAVSAEEKEDEPNQEQDEDPTADPADDLASQDDIASTADPAPKAAKQSKASKDDTPKQPTLAETITATGIVNDDISDTVTLEDFSKALRKVSLDILDKVAEAADIDISDTLVSKDGSTLPDPIRRMHLTLALREHFYPGQKMAAKKSSQFRKVELATLIAKADELGLTYRATNGTNDAITRMWVTKALVDAGVTYEDVVPAPADDLASQDDNAQADASATVEAVTA